MQYSDTLLNLDRLPEPAQAALKAHAGQTVHVDRQTGKITLPANVEENLMDFEKQILIDSNPHSDFYRIPSPDEWTVDPNKRAALDYQHSPQLQAEFGELDVYLAWRRHEGDVRLCGGKHATVI